MLFGFLTPPLFIFALQITALGPELGHLYQGYGEMLAAILRQKLSHCRIEIEEQPKYANLIFLFCGKGFG